jgi:hypothetical protein
MTKPPYFRNDKNIRSPIVGFLRTIKKCLINIYEDVGILPIKGMIVYIWCTSEKPCEEKGSDSFRDGSLRGYCFLKNIKK